MSDQSANKSNNPDKVDPPPEQRQRLIYDGLKAPTASYLAGKRKVPCNLQHSGKRFVHPKGTSNPNVSIHQRLTEFLGESFKESAGTLFCNGCGEEVGLKKTTIQQPIKSSKHSRGNEKLAVKDSSNLSSTIDVINKEEKDKVKRERAGRNVSITFDRKTHVVEALKIILRFLSDDWKIEQSF